MRLVLPSLIVMATMTAVHAAGDVGLTYDATQKPDVQKAMKILGFTEMDLLKGYPEAGMTRILNYCKVKAHGDTKKIAECESAHATILSNRDPSTN